MKPMNKEIEEYSEESKWIQEEANNQWIDE